MQKKKKSKQNNIEYQGERDGKKQQNKSNTKSMNGNEEEIFRQKC